MINIKQRREELGLTIYDVADAVGVSAGTVSRWESSDIKNMKRDKIYKLAKVLQTDPVELTFYDVPENERPKVDVTQYVEELRDNPSLRMLFDASKGVAPEQLEAVADMLRKFKGE